MCPAGHWIVIQPSNLIFKTEDGLPSMHKILSSVLTTINMSITR